MGYLHTPKFPKTFLWGTRWEKGRGDAQSSFSVDVTLMAECELSSCQFDLRWAGLMPAAGQAAEEKCVAEYDTMLDAMEDYYIKPIAVLSFWDMPQWAKDAGGEKSRAAFAEFARCCRFCFEHFGARVRLWLLDAPGECRAALAHACHEAAKDSRVGFAVRQGEEAAGNGADFLALDWAQPCGSTTALRDEICRLWESCGLPVLVTGAATGRTGGTVQMDTLRREVYQTGLAIEDGCRVLGYQVGAFTDVPAEEKVGLVGTKPCGEVCRTSGGRNRIFREAYYWYMKLVRSNGSAWGGRITV